MKFPTDRPVKVVMLGAGGTGGYVAPYVFRLLHIVVDRVSGVRKESAYCFPFCCIGCYKNRSDL